MSDIKSWGTTAAATGQVAAAPDGWPEGMSPADVNNCAREMMAAVRRQMETAEWFDWGYTPSTLSATLTGVTTFTVSGDHRTEFIANRRLKFTDGGVYRYATVTTATYAAPNTTITCALDSGLLTTSASAVAIGILSPTNNSFPKAIDLSLGAVTVTSLDTGGGTASASLVKAVNVNATLFTGGLKTGGLTASASLVKAVNVNATLFTGALNTGGLTASASLVKAVNVNATLFTGALDTNGGTASASLVKAVNVAATGNVSAGGTLTVSTPGGNVSWGTYTPTVGNLGNTSARSGNLSRYLRVGDVVTVSGSFDATTTAQGGTLTTVSLSLPIASASGTGAGVNAVIVSSSLEAGTTNVAGGLATATYLSYISGSVTHYFHFTYLVN